MLADGGKLMGTSERLRRLLGPLVERRAEWQAAFRWAVHSILKPAGSELGWEQRPGPAERRRN